MPTKKLIGEMEWEYNTALANNFYLHRNLNVRYALLCFSPFLFLKILYWITRQLALVKNKKIEPLLAADSWEMSIKESVLILSPTVEVGHTELVVVW